MSYLIHVLHYFSIFHTVSLKPEQDNTQKPPDYDSIDLHNCNPSDIIKGFNKVKKKLVDYIDLENGLLEELCQQGIIIKSLLPEVQNVESLNDDVLAENLDSNKALNKDILDRIAESINDKSKIWTAPKFIEALCKCDQRHIARYIIAAGRKTESVERPLPIELWKVIADNLCCLKKLIDTDKQDFLLQLVQAKCIGSKHKENVGKCEHKEHKAKALLKILKRRRYKDFSSFIYCLKKTKQDSLAKVLETGGVGRIEVQLNERSDWKEIEKEILKQLEGLDDEDNKSELSPDQREMIKKILAELAEYDIDFIGACHGPPNTGSISVFLQVRKGDPYSVLMGSWKSELLKGTLENMFQELLKNSSLLRIPNRSPLVKHVAITELPSVRHGAGKPISFHTKFFSTETIY